MPSASKGKMSAGKQGAALEYRPEAEFPCFPLRQQPVSHVIFTHSGLSKWFPKFLVSPDGVQKIEHIEGTFEDVTSIMVVVEAMRYDAIDGHST